MVSIKTVFAALALAAATVSVAAPAAQAQGTKVIIIDQARIMRESAGGIDIQTKVDAIGQQMTAELQPEATSLQNEAAALDARRQSLTQQSPEAEITAFTADAQAFAQRRQVLATTQQIRQQELALTERKAWATFFQQLEPVLQEVVDENSADVMLDRSQVVFGGPTIDRTDDVITKINARLPTVTVTRERLPQQAPAQ